MPAVRTVTISKATRRASSPIATQTSAKRLRRASSPLLPQYLFPPSSEEEHLQRIEEEPDREVANERVCELQRLAAGSPTNHVKVQNYKNEYDYEEMFGKFIPDGAFAHWEETEQEMRENLEEVFDEAMTTAIHLSPDRLRQFLVGRDNYEAVCGIPFKIHDPIGRRDLEKKLKELAVYDRVKQHSRGDPDLEDKITSRRTCTITAVNPFRLKDPRRLECNTYLRECRAWFLGDNTPQPPTLGDPQFVVMLTNRDRDLVPNADCLGTYIEHEVWHLQIKEYMADAWACARAPAPSFAIPTHFFMGVINLSALVVLYFPAIF
ncbi:hypothetical protein B0H13DRAFT_2326936 [Mycena leptocephala]|nr:hypothetical protein B0H13DRAFT_2326936 [Mycena leptocephala]